MDTYFIYLFIIGVFVILSLTINRRKKNAALSIARKKRGGTREMLELAKRFIDKDVIIATLNDTTVGKITEICDGGIMVEEKGRIEAVNVDFIISIKEYPVDSKGKRNFFA
ncbi:MAG: hypothetical protein WC886_04165 [Saccharofermentanaceae bacterium]|jgi:hypothetical protein|nr:hypothetical protein [Clostridiaceae bacterium]HOO49586.1 hypothetical protein [Saccharofermentans sp.]HPE28263.1 hypothetical protein [Saccharofermentans sp.]HPJ81505.1 hypothetical protein [Saccharofermentans sp.]HPQ32505.1 hypothetical protein [Saccharofermentans sp.]